MIRTTFKQILILTLLVLISTACGNSSKNVFLSPVGSDDQPGTKQKPVRNLSRAMELVKDALEDDHTRTIHVYFREGEYPVHETVVLDAETFGETDVSLVFRPFKNELAVITGGAMIESNLFYQPAYERRVEEMFNKLTALQEKYSDTLALELQFDRVY